MKSIKRHWGWFRYVIAMVFGVTMNACGGQSLEQPSSAVVCGCPATPACDAGLCWRADGLGCEYELNGFARLVERDGGRAVCSSCASFPADAGVDCEAA